MSVLNISIGLNIFFIIFLIVIWSINKEKQQLLYRTFRKQNNGLFNPAIKAYHFMLFYGSLYSMSLRYNVELKNALLYLWRETRYSPNNYKEHFDDLMYDLVKENVINQKYIDKKWPSGEIAELNTEAYKIYDKHKQREQG